MATLPKNTSEAFKRLNPSLYVKEVMPMNSQNDDIARIPCPEMPCKVGADFTNLVITPSTDEEKLNKTERAWLRQLRLTHPESNIGIQSITLKLGDDCRYTPDFWTIDPNGQLFFWECKGFWRDDAKAKIKIAARQFRWARFIVVTKEKTGFNETRINS